MACHDHASDWRLERTVPPAFFATIGGVACILAVDDISS